MTHLLVLLGNNKLVQVKTSYLSHVCIFRDPSLMKLLLKVENGKPDIESNIRSIV